LYPQDTDENGVRYYRVTFTVKATMVNDVLKFELFYKGLSYGEVTARFE
jgi:hypothetical protein